MFISAKTVKNECILFNVSLISFVLCKKNKAVVFTYDGEFFDLDESYEDFYQRLCKFLSC